MPYLSDGATWVPESSASGYTQIMQNQLRSQPVNGYGSGSGSNYGGGVGMSWSPAPGYSVQPDGSVGPTGGGAGSGSATGSASGSMSVPASNIPPPDMQSFQYTQNQQNYPWYMRGLGENMSQQAYQTQVNQGARLGASVQGVMAAQNLQNMQRLNYMSQAGQQDLTVGQAMATEIQRRNDEALRKYQLQLMGRGQDLSYQAQMAAIAARNSGAVSAGGSQSGQFQAGGKLRSGGTGQGTYTDIFGNVSIGGTPVKYGGSANNPYANPFASTSQQASQGPLAGGYGTGVTNTASQGWQPYASGSNPGDPYNVMTMGIF